tara:strand:- start:1730 stop:2152 length:423 start_codon:yes stop_codon:yes gene_type:complete
MKVTVYIASDHAGYDLKNKIIDFNKNFIDLGTVNKDRVDYPDYAFKLVSMMQSNSNSRGILICGSGIGMAITANRNKQIRAGLAFNPEIAKLMRQHNDANILVLPGRFMDIHEALKCVENFLNSEFEGGRHEKRIYKLSK